MSAIRNEIEQYIKIIPDSKLEALRPLLEVLAGEVMVIDNILSDAERAVIEKGRKDYQKGGYVSIDDLK